MVTEFMDMAIAEWNNLAKKKMPKVLNSSMSSTVIMNEEAERILSKPVIKKKKKKKKKKEPFNPHMLLKIVQMFGKDSKNLINLRFVLMYMLG